MIAFPHAKINLGLSIISKRPDGFHNLESIFYPLAIRDILEIVPSAETRFIPTGLPVPGKTEENLVLRAFDMLKKDYSQMSPMEIHLHKAIPMGAGMGGGSSDAAAILMMLNSYFELKIPDSRLSAYALELGSDCPFFLQKQCCYASSRGEILEPVYPALSSYSFLLVHPEIRIETAWAFSMINPAPARFNLKESILQPPESWMGTLFNDFETPVFEAYPSLATIKDRLYQSGALYASMTGSGSTIYGIFPKSKTPVIHFENARQSLVN